MTGMIRKKLREKSGASIFMGLIFLLVCLTVGSVALTASTAAAGKLAEQQENEQNYLTVASAARLLRDRIGVLTYKQVTVDHSAHPGTLAASDAATGGKVILESELTNRCQIISDPSLTASEVTFQIDLVPPPAPASGAPDWKTVYGSLKVEADGRILVKLWLGNADGSDSHNRMKLEFCPDGGAPAQQTVVTYTETTEPDGTVTYTPIITVTTTCSWPEGGCTITKGS